jgi:putative endonuclease
MNTRKIGDAGEAAAHDFLIGIGAQIVARNVRIAGAEIDLIARFGDLHAFIEVKSRRSAQYGRPAEAVTPAKQKAIVRAAQAWAAEHALTDAPLRFDVIEVLPGVIRHIPGAFDASG